MSRLMEKAVDLVNQIHACMRNAETCSAIADVIRELPFVFKDGDKIIGLEGVLTPEQMEEIRQVVINKIEDNQADAERFLAVITGEDKNGLVQEEADLADEVAQEFEDLDAELEALIDQIDDEPVVPAPKKKTKKKVENKKEEESKVIVTPEDVRRLYLEENKTLDEVANILGTNRSAVYKVVSAYGLRKPSKKDACFRG